VLENYEAESQAIKIRLRAERRRGELVKAGKQNGTIDAGQGGDRKSPSDNTRVKPKTLADLGISYQQSSDWQKLAEVPEETFEAKLNDSTVRRARSAKPLLAGDDAPQDRERVFLRTDDSIAMIAGHQCESAAPVRMKLAQENAPVASRHGDLPRLRTVGVVDGNITALESGCHRIIRDADGVFLDSSALVW
jgi:hypothetical protein